MSYDCCFYVSSIICGALLKDRKNECCETFKKWIKYKFKMVNLRIENSMGVTGWWGGGWWVAENFQLSYDHGRANPANPYGRHPLFSGFFRKSASVEPFVCICF